ncbi:hypothetical protein Tco_0720031 [Tanacetum coccineum]
MNTKIFIDNQSTICIVKNPVFHQRTKHIEIRHHFIRDANEKNLIQVLKIHTDDNVADLLTKAFDGPRFAYLIDMRCFGGILFFLWYAGIPYCCWSLSFCSKFWVRSVVSMFTAGSFQSCDASLVLLVFPFIAGSTPMSGSVVPDSAGGSLILDWGFNAFFLDSVRRADSAGVVVVDKLPDDVMRLLITGMLEPISESASFPRSRLLNIWGCEVIPLCGIRRLTNSAVLRVRVHDDIEILWKGRQSCCVCPFILMMSEGILATQDDWVVSCWKIVSKSSVNDVAHRLKVQTYSVGMLWKFWTVLFRRLRMGLRIPDECIALTPIIDFQLFDLMYILVNGAVAAKSGSCCLRDVAASFDSAVHRVHAVSFDAAVASIVSAACCTAAGYFVYCCCLLCSCCSSILLPQEDLSRNLELTESTPSLGEDCWNKLQTISVHSADFVSVGHVSCPADSDRNLADGMSKLEEIDIDVYLLRDFSFLVD